VPYLDWLKSQGHTVDLAIRNNGNIKFSSCDQCHYLNFPRVLFERENFNAYKRLQNIIMDGDYQLIHCHTPIPSAICRLSARKWRKQGGKVLYTAHGFHFYRGGPLSQWLTYYPVERWLSSYTDGIVTINKEDYEHARKFSSSTTKVHLIPGIGVASKFADAVLEDKVAIRQSLGLRPQDFVVTYIAEFIHRKNHQFIVKASGRLIEKIPNLKILFVGTGALLSQVKQLIVDNGQENLIHCLGYREDVQRIAHITDVAVSASLHEGLGLGLAEQMMCGIPVVASQDKGHAELVDHGVNGYIFQQGNAQEFIDDLVSLYESKELRQRMGAESKIKSQKFRIESSLSAMADIYSQYL